MINYRQKLSTKNMILVSFLLFSMFFGAGNLIFPPFIGQYAAGATPVVMAGFLFTDVVLSIFALVVVARFGGLVPLASLVERHFGLIFSIIIYLTLGPLMTIPRAASLPFEMAMAPYMSAKTNLLVLRVSYSFVFFVIVLWLCLTPSKLVERIGKYTAPALVILIIFLFINFVIRGNKSVGNIQDIYTNMPFLVGFADGYKTVDAIAGLTYAMVIVGTFVNLGINDSKQQMKYTLFAGILAGCVITFLYVMVAYMGMQSSGVYELHENGAWIIRAIVYQLFGNGGAILTAAIFTLACLNVCVGLTNSCTHFLISQFKSLNHKKCVYTIIIFSFFVCNLGLNQILILSVPLLNAIYPAAIVLILLGITHRLWQNNKYVYPFVVLGVAFESMIYTLDELGLHIWAITRGMSHILPLYSMGYGWIGVAGVMLIISIIISNIKNK